MRKRNAFLPVLVGGGTAGVLDLLFACLREGWRTPLGVAAGLLGRHAMHGGAGTYVLGVCLHFFIALTAATVYYEASRGLPFLRQYPLVCGLCFGMAVELFMTLIVLPISALHLTGPFSLHDLLEGLLVHMLLIGLPIAYSVRRFASYGARQQGDGYWRNITNESNSLV